MRSIHRVLRGIGLFLLPTLCVACGANRGEVGAAPDEVRFGDRALSLAPYLDLLPFEPILPIFEEDRLLYLHNGALVQQAPVSRPGWGPFALLPPEPPGPQARATLLRTVPLSAPGDLTSGRALIGDAWSPPTRGPAAYHAPSKTLYLAAPSGSEDEGSPSLYRIGLDGGRPFAVADELISPSFAVAPEGDRLATVVQRPEGERCLRIIEIAAGGQDLLCDGPAARFTDGPLSWAPDSRGLLIPVQLADRGSQRHLAWVPLQRPELQLVIEASAGGASARAVPTWLDPDRFLFTATTPGAYRVGSYDLRQGTLRWHHTGAGELLDLLLLRPDEEPLLLAAIRGDEGDRLLSLDLHGQVHHRLPLDGAARILGDDGRRTALIQWTSAQTPFESATLTVQPDGAMQLEPYLQTPPEAVQRITHCEVEPVQIPGPTPGADSPSTHPGLLYTPRRPLAHQAARILSRPGPAQAFDADTQLWCEAGITTLALLEPSPHAEKPEGRAAALDAAHFLVERGLPPERIGLYGRGEASEAVVHALSAAVAGPFPFAFGIAEAPIRPLAWFGPLQAPLLVLRSAGSSPEPAPDGPCAEAPERCTVVSLEGADRPAWSPDDARRVWAARLSFLEAVLGP